MSQNNPTSNQVSQDANRTLRLRGNKLYCLPVIIVTPVNIRHRSAGESSKITNGLRIGLSSAGTLPPLHHPNGGFDEACTYDSRNWFGAGVFGPWTESG